MIADVQARAEPLPAAPPVSERPARQPGIVGVLGRAVAALNGVLVALCAAALVGAAGILSYSVLVRYALQEATYWQDEASVFLIVGATFLSAAHVQARRGHVGIEALAAILSPAVNRVRALLVDVLSFAFCAFFAWKSWTLWDEAWTDGQISSSTWGPPLWIPYSLMAAGMTLLAVQIALQIAVALTRERTS